MGVRSDRPLKPDFGLVPIRRRRSYRPVLQRQGNHPAAGDAPPHPDLGFLLPAGCPVLAGLDDIVLIARDTLVAAPLDIGGQRLHARRDAEGEPYARRHERLIVRGVDFVEGVVFRLYPTGDAGELGAGFVDGRRPLILDVANFIRAGRRLNGEGIGVARPSRRELADKVSVTDAHVLDQLVRATGGAEQIVAHGDFEEVANVGHVLDQRHGVR